MYWDLQGQLKLIQGLKQKDLRDFKKKNCYNFVFVVIELKLDIFNYYANEQTQKFKLNNILKIHLENKINTILFGELIS